MNKEQGGMNVEQGTRNVESRNGAPTSSFKIPCSLFDIRSLVRHSLLFPLVLRGYYLKFFFKVTGKDLWIIKPYLVGDFGDAYLALFE